MELPEAVRAVAGDIRALMLALLVIMAEVGAVVMVMPRRLIIQAVMAVQV
jgi:hypothetical protein